jgi:pimeloyl-ACP methyl ester carboxylesterase
MPVAQVNGISIAYDDVGAGPGLVLVHGHPFDRSMWAPQLAELAAVCRVVAPDLRGYGGSSVIGGRTGLDTFAADIEALVDRLGLDRVLVGGVSMGGQVVLECARRWGDRISGLLLADTFARADDEAARARRRAAADRLEREGMAGYAAEALPRMIAAYNVTALPDVAGHVHRMMLSAPPAGAAAALRGRAERPDYTDLLGAIAVPTLVLVGRDDEFTPVSDAQYLQQRIPDAELVIVEGAGHLPNLEQPAAVNAALLRLLHRAGIPLATRTVTARQERPPTAA